MTEQQITIKKSTYNKFLAALVVLAVAFSFASGYIVGQGKVSVGTPTVTNNAQQGQQPTQAAPSQQAAPSRTQVTLQSNDPVEGSANAKVTVVEFSDFQCPFCRRFYNQTFSQIEANYVQTGKIKLVFKNFPLESLHPSAKAAAETAECANDQGKFWEMHNKIFNEQQKLDPSGGTVQFTADDLKKWAADIGLNTATFNSCLDGSKDDAAVSADFQDGVTAGVQGTPTFYIGSPAKGYTQLVGAQPYSVIKAAIDQELGS